jgi:hypothetical protein
MADRPQSPAPGAQVRLHSALLNSGFFQLGIHAFELLLQLLFHAGDHVVDSFLSKDCISETCEQPLLEIIPSNQHGISANRITPLMMHRTSVAIGAMSAAATHEDDTSTADTTLEQTGK